MSNDLTLTTFFQDFRSGMKEHLEQISVFTIALTTNILEDMGIEIKTQTEIRAMNLALEINMCKTNIDRMYQQYSNSTDHVTAQKYVDAAKVLEAEMKASVNALNELANNNQATISHNPLETAKNIVKDSRFSVELFDKLSKAASVTSIGKELIDFVESYKFTGDVDEKELNDVAKEIAGFVSSFAETPRLDKVIKAIGLNPKSLFTVAARSSLISWLLIEEYQFVYGIAKDYFENKGVYENEGFINWVDKILDPINGVTIKNPTDFNAVSSVYSLLQANARNTLNEADWKQLFGADEVRKMDMDKVKNVLKESIKIITGKEITVDTTEQMVKAVQENYKAFKDMRGFSLLLADRETLWKAVTSKELYEYSDLGLAHRYSLKNLNNFLITSNENSNEKVSIYSKHNQNGELDMYSPDNKNGMTVEYIQDRAKMLWFKIEYDSQNLSYDKRLNEGLLPFPVRGNLQFIDNDSNITLDIDGLGINERKYFRFGDTGDDNLTGGGLQDKLYGGLGNDTLDGGKGSDYLEGVDGDDQLYGNDDNDILYGNNDNDKLYGGFGDDYLYDENNDGKLHAEIDLDFFK